MFLYRTYYVHRDMEMVTSERGENFISNADRLAKEQALHMLYVPGISGNRVCHCLGLNLDIPYKASALLTDPAKMKCTF